MPKKDQKKIFLTNQGIARLKTELEHLKSVKRKAVIERVAQARRSGNIVDDDIELNAAFQEQSFIEGRIAELEEVLKRAQVIDEKTVSQRKTVGLGSTVVVEVDGEKDEFTIVGSFEADPMKGLISSESIVAKALLGAKVGDVIKVASAIETSYKILEIK